MLRLQKKCVVCGKTIKKGEEIKKHGAQFCSSVCAEKYEELFREAKKKIDLNNCC